MWDREWQPQRPVDVIISNAALQWVPEQLAVLAGWLELLAAGAQAGLPFLVLELPGGLGGDPGLRVEL